MKLTYIELAKQGKVVNVSLLPEGNGHLLEWSMEDPYNGNISYNIILNMHRKTVDVQVFEWKDGSDDWEHTSTIHGTQALQIAKNFNVIQ